MSTAIETHAERMERGGREHGEKYGREAGAFYAAGTPGHAYAMLAGLIQGLAGASDDFTRGVVAGCAAALYDAEPAA